MVLQRLIIKNYRNYAEAEIFPSEHLNLFVGDNAQGKTNLLESIYFSSIGRSLRTTRDKELIKWGESQAVVKTRISKKCGSEDILIKLDGAKHISINNLPITKMGQLMGVLMTVLFTPDELRIVKEGPSERRRFMDIALCQLSRVYFDCLTRYNRILSQRNKLLKGAPTDNEIDLWDYQLAGEGAKIIKTRRGFVSRLGAIAESVHRDITGDEVLKLSYEGAAGDDIETITKNLLSALKSSRPRDRALCVTSVGAQRDDISIIGNDIDLRTYGSQGQQRSAALSLKLAEMELLEEQTGEYPVLLLDDVLSELDESRQNKLLQKIRAYQTIITGTHLTAEVRARLGEVKEYRVSGGKVIEIK